VSPREDTTGRLAGAPPVRIAILTYDSHQSRLIVRHLLDRFPRQIVGVMRSDVTIAGKSAWQAARFLVARTGLGFVARKAAEIAISRAAAGVLGVLGQRPSVAALARMARDAGVPLAATARVNGAAAVEQVRQWRPDVVVSVHFNQRIRGPVIALAPRGVINVHGALLPRNRGLFPYFWALANGDSETGVTVHWVDEDFDTGPILIQEALGVGAEDTVFSLAGKGAALGAMLVERALCLIEAGHPPAIAQDAGRATYGSWPTRADVRRLRGRGRRYGSLTEIWRECARAAP
jgi:folate-dependent phosphoribosylglycinamide formyltransferase PurN